MQIRLVLLIVGLLLISAVIIIVATGTEGRSEPTGYIAPKVAVIDQSNDGWAKTALKRVTNPPLGLPAVPVPKSNQLTVEKIKLGRKLYFDRRLSHNDTMSCAMCHVPEQGFTNNELATSVGLEGRSIKRNAPATFNVAYEPRMFHDGRDTSLETQILGPLLSPVEMANPSMGMVIEEIKGLKDYAGLFEAAFGEPPDIRNLGEALAGYQRTVLSGDAAFDRWRLAGKENAMSASAKRGFELFKGKGQCVTCHVIEDDTALFTDHGFHNTGIGYRSDVIEQAREDKVAVEIAPGLVVKVDRDAVNAVGEPHQKDLGRMEVTEVPADLYFFKTPGLRNVALTAPYMHNGSLRTLDEVVRFYNKGGIANLGLSPSIKPLGLGDREITDLVAFLRSLTGSNVDELIAEARSAAPDNY